MNAQQTIHQLVAKSGIEINGNKQTDIQVFDRSLYNRIFASGKLAAGETFMEKKWDSKDLVGTLSLLLSSGAVDDLRSVSTVWLALKAKLFNLQSKKRAFEVGEEHYNYGNDMYKAMLGPTMTYTSGVWSENVTNLEESQNEKHRILCEQLGLKPGDRVLDIGCGWGGFMNYAAKNYGVSCVGLSISTEQTKWGREWCKDLPIEFVISDYREYKDQACFDHIISVEMLEHVGPKNYTDYFKKVHELLKPGGHFALQVIGTPLPNGQADPWLDKYIFPNGTLPAMGQLVGATRNLLVWDSVQDIGVHYDRTLMEWWRNLERAYPDLKKQDPAKYNERFLRMFQYYLQSCAALFRTRTCFDWQIILTKK